MWTHRYHTLITARSLILKIPDFLNFGQQGREYDDFACFHASDGDADFDMRLKVDLNKIESDFYSRPAGVIAWQDRRCLLLSSMTLEHGKS